jgi:hypothetical protein
MSYITRFFSALFTPIRLLFTSPETLITGPKRLLGLSLPARGAVLAALFLGLAIAVGVSLRWKDVGLSSLPYLLVMWFVIPSLLYVVLQAWLEPGLAEFDDIDRAWKAGVKELRRNGLEIGDLPLFLILGSAGESFERNLLDAAKLSPTVSHFPQGQSALRWYATAEAVYLVASDVGRLSHSNAKAREALLRTQRGPDDAPAGATPRVFDPVRATLEVDTPAQEVADAQRTPPPRLAPLAQGDLRGTLQIDGEEPAAIGKAAAGAAPQVKGLAIDENQLEWQSRRVDYLGRLVRRARQPLCPVNGVLTLLSFPYLQLGKEAGRQVAEAVRMDLETLLAAFQLRSPVTALVTGMEDESGFRELVRRLGPDRAAMNKFGSGFQVWFDADEDNLVPLCQVACGRFEEFIYAEFKEADALTDPAKSTGNRKLFSLLCKVRGEFQTVLQGVLVGGFSQQIAPDERPKGFLFSGCYFAATGGPQDCQAFVKGVFDDLSTEQAYLEWTDKAISNDILSRRAAYGMFVFDVLLALGATYWWWPRK